MNAAVAVLEASLEAWAGQVRAGQVRARAPRAFPEALSPCRIDAGKGRRRHRCSAFHAGLVWDYRDARRVHEERLEAAALGYAAEEAEYRRDVGCVTFGGWLRSYRGAGD